MLEKILFVILCSLSITSYSQLFIDDGVDGSLYITDASGGTLTTHETLFSNIALYVDSSITIEGTFVNNSAEVQLTGDFSNTGTFTTTGDEVFVGGSAQTIAGTFTGTNDFYNLIVNKTASTIATITSNTEINSTGILAFEGGVISTGNNYVYVKNTLTSSIAGAGANGTLDKFIEGELRRNMTTGNTYDFPVGGTHIDAGGGDGIQYALIKPNIGNGVTSVLFNDSTGIGTLNSIDVCSSGSGDFIDIKYRIRNGSWNITNPGGGISNYNVTLNPTDYTDNGYVDYTIIKDGLPTGKDPCDGVATTIPITHDSLTSFSLFEIVASTSITPLPIELIGFNAKVIEDDKVQLDWQTASEINNDFFTIERSKNGQDWQEIALVYGAGNSSVLLNYSTIDNAPFNGISYYKLKQTDFDGKFEYSKLRRVNIQQSVNMQIEIHPNPATNQIIIKGSSNELEEIVLYNTLGQNVTSLTNKDINNENQLVIDISKLNTGIYYVKTKTTANKAYKQ
jgi:hypothetical protein